MLPWRRDGELYKHRLGDCLVPDHRDLHYVERFSRSHGGAVESGHPGDEGSGDPDGEARDPASFTITVTNNGDVNLTPIAILDYINGVKVAECSQNLTGLGPNDVDELHMLPWRRDGELYKHRLGDCLVPDHRDLHYVERFSRSHGGAVESVRPVTKDPATQTVKSGDPASFTITVTNNGDVNLTPIAVLDYINGVKVPECSHNLTGLGPNDSTSYTCSHGGETASYTNIVSAIAWSPITGTYIMWNDSAEVTVVYPMPFR